jgi:hypothetical protein
VLVVGIVGVRLAQYARSMAPSAAKARVSCRDERSVRLRRGALRTSCLLWCLDAPGYRDWYLN